MLFTAITSKVYQSATGAWYIFWTLVTYIVDNGQDNCGQHIMFHNKQLQNATLALCSWLHYGAIHQIRLVSGSSTLVSINDPVQGSSTLVWTNLDDPWKRRGVSHKPDVHKREKIAYQSLTPPLPFCVIMTYIYDIIIHDDIKQTVLPLWWQNGSFYVIMTGSHGWWAIDMVKEWISCGLGL